VESHLADLISLSEKADDLSQWRGYTPPSQGVWIGFNTQALKQALKKMKGVGTNGLDSLCLAG
jgi:hypothetical protein